MIDSDQATATQYSDKNSIHESSHATESGIKTKNEEDDFSAAIAIVGMGIRLSGGITSTDEFWSLLIQGKNGLTEVPSTRYRIDSFYGKQQSVKMRRGYFLHQDPALFDAEFFGISTKEAEKMDPQQRLLLEVTADCLEDAGETELRGLKVACYIGVFGEDWLGLSHHDPQTIDRYHISSTGHFALSNRISHHFDWHGPSMTIQTACSSSMVSLYEGCQALLRNECDAAVVGGVNLLLNPVMTMAMSDAKVLAADGTCKTFDAAADGYGRGEGVSVVLIKRLEDAIRNNDAIRAVIRATDTNFDGKRPSASVPDVDKQESLIRRTYQRAGISNIRDTVFFECHGTGTQAGDIVEVTAVARALQTDKDMVTEPIWIGSVKPNVGHTEGASGLTSVIKATLCLENDIIPPNVFFNIPNPKIPFQMANLFVPREPTPFPTGRKKRISVNSFGVGGSNGHAILESASSCVRSSEGYTSNSAPTDSSNDGNLLVLSAKTQDALEKRIADLVRYIGQNKVCNLNDLSYTLCCRREHFSHRAYAVVSPRRPVSRTDFRAPHVPPSLKLDSIWLFTGQGSQWVGMAQQLLRDSNSFQSDMEELEAALKSLPDAPDWSISRELAKSGSGGSRINETEIAQPLSTAIAIGLVNHLRRWGLRPSAVVGHSSGELAAAYAAGAISATSAICMAYYRGLVSKLRENQGSMVAVGLGREDIQGLLQQVCNVDVACHNSPRSLVLSGNLSDLDEITCLVKQTYPEALCKRLRVAVAYHSSQMHDLAAVYEQYISPIIQHTPSMIPMYSTVSSEKITDPTKLDASYWSSGLSSTVEFSQAIENVFSDFKESQLALVEVGTHSTFSTFIKHILEVSTAADQGRARIYIPTLTRNDPDASAQLLAVVGRLHCLGVVIDMTRVTGVRRVLCSLPGYPWERQLYRRESRLVRDWRLGAVAHHELLGSRLVAMSDAEPAWRNLLQLGNVLWLSDHTLGGKVVFPVAGYIAMAGAACLQLYSDSVSYSVRNLVLSSVLTLVSGRQLEILTTLKRQRYNDLTESEWYDFTISCHNGSGWTKHCSGQVRADNHFSMPKHHEPHVIPAPYARKVNTDQWYTSIRKQGYEYGPVFRGLKDVSADPVKIAAVGTIPEMSGDKTDTTYTLHPIVIDRCLQMMGIAHCHGLTRRVGVMEVPKSIEFVSVARASQKTIVSARGIDDGGQGESWNAIAVSDGAPVLYIQNLRSTVLSMNWKQQTTIPPLATLRWTPLVDLLPPEELLLSNSSIRAAGEKQLPWESFISQLGHSQPSLRVLEIGIDAPDTTKSNLGLLRTSEGTPLFSSYTLTSVSTASLDQPKLMFDDTAGVHFKVYDTQGDLENQGFEPHSFDLVVTSDATLLLSPIAVASLRRLSTHSGWLLVQNADLPVPTDADTHEGATATDTAEQCKKLLQLEGFLCEEALIEEQTDLGTGIQKITLLAKVIRNGAELSKEIKLLVGSHESAEADAIARQLAKRGYTVTRTTLGTALPAGQNIVSLVDFDYHGLHKLPETVYQQLKEFLLNGRSNHVLWLTGAAQLDCRDPRYGLAYGLVRTLRRECRLDLSILELNEINAASAKLIADLQNWIEHAPDSGDLKRDSEFAILDGKVHVGRYHWVSALPRPEINSASAKRVGKLQLRRNLSDKVCNWDPSDLAELQEDEIQVQLRYVGLNFRDILVTAGLVGNRNELGIEASGVVTNVGSKVTGFAIHDRVGILGSGLCQTRINVRSDSCWKIPKKISLEYAATTLVPFLTAIYALVHVGGLKEGQTVLVHSACGGVGLAALQICQMLKAKVYATVGSEDKIAYLETHFSLPRTHIFNSRDDSFLSGVMRETNGMGVDIVVNSLAGKLLHVSWECVASFGKLLELGKIDFSTNATLSMSPFAKNRAFIGVDLLQLATERPEILASLVRSVCSHLEAGQLSPLPLCDILDASNATDALRQMQVGQHIGRFALRMPGNTDNLPMLLNSPDVRFQCHASYLLVGGTGGLGRVVSNWMVERGARHLVYLSRTVSPEESSAFVRELAVQGCKAEFIAGSVTNPENVQRAIAACCKEQQRPLKGVVQLSATLRDRTFSNMTHEEWNECLGPKVTGTWNLHQALLQTQDVVALDFFVLFGSLAGVYGNGGQANYAAANTYLESFVHYRRRLGLPCSLLNLGPVGDAGMLTRDDRLLRALRETRSVQLLCEADVCRGLGIAIAQSPVASIINEKSGLGIVQKPAVSTPLAIVNLGMSTTGEWIASDARFVLHGNLDCNRSSKASIVDNHFYTFMAQLEENPSILNQPETERVICREIARLMTGYLGGGGGGGGQEDIGDEDIGNIAIDSLMAIEIKDWVRGNMNLDVSMDQTSRSRTSGELASHTVERLKVKYGLIES